MVVMFIATKCPYSNAYNDRMRDMAAAYEKKGVLFAGINSNKSEPAEEVISHASQHGLRFLLMKDPDNKVADLYEARHTPEVFVIDPEGKLRYHGRIDENYEDPSKVTSPDLKNALDALLAGQPIAKAETKAFGCPLPALLARRHLMRAPAPTVVAVLTDDPMAPIDVPHMCAADGFEVLAIRRAGDESRMIIRKP